MNHHPKELVSVIVCTYNRCESLRDTLNHLAKQKMNEEYQVEFIIVDNNSSDNTKQIIEEKASEFNGRLRYIFEKKQGISAAHNRGIGESKGDILMFTDDDITMASEWIDHTYQCFKKHNADGVFGKIFPVWGNAKVPVWLSENKRLWAHLAMLDHGDKEFQVDDKSQHFFGANFALKKEIFENGFKFNENIGIFGAKRGQGEDTELFYHVLENGYKLMYEPKSIVDHKVEEQRITKSYFRNWSYGYGRDMAAVEMDTAYTRHLNIPRWHIRSFFALPFKWLFAMISFDSVKAADCQFRWFISLGYISTCLKGKKK